MVATLHDGPAARSAHGKIKAVVSEVLVHFLVHYLFIDFGC